MTTSDLLILGGGITGAATACLAARRGYSVVLIERGDLASGASGATSHMLHGGLRYLERARFGLVRQALHERRFWLDRAPDFAQPIRFLVPLPAGGRVSPFKLRAALWLYDRLAGRLNLESADTLSAQELGAMEPGLNVSSCRGGGAYSDGVMDDAALTIALVREARVHGALIRTWREPTDITRSADGTFELTARDVLADDADRPRDMIRARVLINATGSWSDATRAWASRRLNASRPAPAPLLAPSRGIHLVYPALTRGHGLLFFSRTDGRAIFVVPFHGRSLVGTTEIAVDSPPTTDQLRPNVAEIAYLRRELALVLPNSSAQEPLALFSGIRPLLAGAGGTGNASREHRVIDDKGLITVAGGKYTTARLMARDVLSAAAQHLSHHPPAPIDDLPPRLERWPDNTDPERLADESINDLFARCVDDVLRRRSRLWLADDRGLGQVGAVATAMGIRLGWSLGRRNAEVDRYRQSIADEQALLAGAGGAA